MRIPNLIGTPPQLSLHGGIPPRQAEAFCLFALDGWTYEQIATHFGSSVNAVRVLLHRARKRLQDPLKDSAADSMKAGK